MKEMNENDNSITFHKMIIQTVTKLLQITKINWTLTLIWVGFLGVCFAVVVVGGWGKITPLV